MADHGFFIGRVHALGLLGSRKVPDLDVGGGKLAGADTPLEEEVELGE